MGVKISSLPINTLPYSGGEKIPLVQGSETRAGTLSSFINYLSGSLGSSSSDTGLRSLSGNWQNTYTTVQSNSGNWQNTYTTFRANSANYALKNANNNFTVGQTFNGSITATSVVLSGGTSPVSYSLKRFDGDGSFGITNTLSYSTNANNFIAFGNAAGDGSITGSITDVVAIGYGAGSEIASSDPASTASYIVSIGTNAGKLISTNGGNTSDIVAIGRDAGNSVGDASTGPISDIIAIGQYSAATLGSGGTMVNDIIAIGSSAGRDAGGIFGTVSNSIAIGTTAGYFAGYNNGTLAGMIAIGQTAGHSAGSALGSLTRLIAIGQESGFSVAKDDGNASDIISLGYMSGYNIATGVDASATDIICIGRESGSNIGAVRYAGALGSAANITALGNFAGNAIGSSSDQTSINGYAIDVIAIGTQSGVQAGSGGGDNAGSISDGIFIGNQAGYFAGRGDIGSGDVNNLIAIGREAGYKSGYQTTSNNNIFIGLSSGYTKQGSRNTFIGDLTNTSPTSAVNLSGCIAIGYGARPTARNTIAIGSASTPLSVVPGGSITNSLSGLKIMINGNYYTIPLLA